MKIFISFSGARSHAVAEALRDWLPRVIQQIVPFLSERDIDKGARWGDKLARELADTHFGIICVTSDDSNSPWINYEAGALSKAVEQAHVAPFLFDIEKRQVGYPLAQFQMVSNSYLEVNGLLKSINGLCSSPLPGEILNDQFRMWWPDLEKKMVKIAQDPLIAPTQDSPPKSESEVLDEILNLSRRQDRVLAEILMGRFLSDQTPNGIPDRLLPLVEIGSELSDEDLELLISIGRPSLTPLPPEHRTDLCSFDDVAELRKWLYSQEADRNHGALVKMAQRWLESIASWGDETFVFDIRLARIEQGLGTFYRVYCDYHGPASRTNSEMFRADRNLEAST